MDTPWLIVGLCTVLVVVLLWYLFYYTVAEEVAEAFVNEPVKPKHKLSVKAGEYDDYNNVIQEMALDAEVFASQQQYVQDINQLNLGPSNLTERTDPNDIVPWVGLRRPDYNSVPISDSARQISTEDSGQMYKPTKYIL